MFCTACWSTIMAGPLLLQVVKENLSLLLPPHRVSKRVLIRRGEGLVWSLIMACCIHDDRVGLQT